MAIDSTASSTAAQQAATNSTALGRARLAENFDTFLSLLTTQLKNQDPLSPLDSNQFTQQLTQMTGVEQQLATNDLLKQLVSNTANGLSTAVSLIGKQVRAATDGANLVNGKADWGYKLAADAADVRLEVLDSKGNIVQAVAVKDAKAGDNTFAWNGKDRAGNQLPDGAYTLRVTAKDASGADVASTGFITGIVSGVEQADGQTLITVGGSKVTWDKVTSVAEAPAKTSTPPPTATSEETA